MASWRNLFAVAALLPGVVAAADPAMLELIMPDARAVMEVDLDRMASSPLGQAMSPQVKAEWASFRPSWQDSSSAIGGLDWSRYAQEVIFASGPPAAPGRPGPSLTIVRGLIDPAWIESLGALRGNKSSFLGVPILSSGQGNAVVAFLDGSIAVIGQAAEVKAAIRRRGQNTPPSPVLADGLARYEGQYDVWMVSSGPLGSTAKPPAGQPPAGQSPAGQPPAGPSVPAGPSLKGLDRLESFTGGLRLSPDVELSAEMTMRNEKDVADMTEELRWFAGVVQTQEKTAISLEDINFTADGKRLTLSLQVPEQQIRAALQQRQVGGAARASRRAVRPPEIESGFPEPPTGTIRVQSSAADMGTVLVPISKP